MENKVFDATASETYGVETFIKQINSNNLSNFWSIVKTYPSCWLLRVWFLILVFVQ